MQINKYNNITNCNSKNYRQTYPLSPNFKGLISVAKSEKAIRGVEFSLRIIGNKIADFFTNKNLKKIIKEISEIKPSANKIYLQQLEDISRIYSSKKNIEINLQDKILEKIAKNNDSVIFIMSHSNQNEDPQMLAVLHMFLVKVYEKLGKTKKFPLPKIIMNQDILKSMNQTKRKAFEAFGAVGVDAAINCPNKELNSKAFIPLIKDFAQKKCNIFIFPEGRLAIYKNLPLEVRFQNGTAELVNKLLNIKKRVTVVPVNFSYGKRLKNNFNVIQIGEPLIFLRKGEKTTSTAGNITKSKYADKNFLAFFEKHKTETDVTITKSGIPLSPKEVTPFIKSIICENMEITEKEAIEKLSETTKPPCIVV